MNPEDYHYPPRDPIREYELKMKFSDMSASSLADYYRAHPKDSDFHEYMTSYATRETNQMVLIILEEPKRSRTSELRELKSA